MILLVNTSQWYCKSTNIRSTERN